MRSIILAALVLFATPILLTAQSAAPAAFEGWSRNRATINDFIIDRVEPLIEN